MNSKPASRECIFVVEDDERMSSLYEELLKSIGLDVRLFPSGEEFFHACSPDWEGGVVVDLRMKGMSGIEVLRRLRTINPQLPAIVVTGFGEIRSTVQAMKLGAIDFLEKPFANSDLIEAVQVMLARSRKLRLEHAERLELQSSLATLSAREHEIAQLILRGMTSRDIASLLEISPRTVDVHRGRILVKLKCTSAVELAALLSRFSQDTP